MIIIINIRTIGFICHINSKRGKSNHDDVRRNIWSCL